MILVCSFCNNEERDDLKIIEGQDACVCEECFKVLGEEFGAIEYTDVQVTRKFLKPHEIKKKLDEHVIGQEEAKKLLSVAVYNHYKRIYSKTSIEIQKTNILLQGPTGSGKTFLMQTLAKILKVPLVIVDATTFTEAGYVGEDVESILEKLLVKANGDIEKAEQGIVYVDEIDKIIASKGGGTKTKDPSGEGVQQALLKMVENSEIEVSVNLPNYGKVKKTMSTKNILFVAGGAFVDLDKIIEKRITNKGGTIGFGQKKTDKDARIDKGIKSQDIINFGLIPEFVGRLPVIVGLNILTKKDLKDILTKPKEAIIKQYKALFKIDGIDLEFSEGALDLIVSEAISQDVGARGLKGVIEKKMYNLMYELPQSNNVKSYVVTEDFLTK